MRIASVDQVELGKIMELSITGQVLRWGKAIEPLWRTITVQSGWMELEES